MYIYSLFNRFIISATMQKKCNRGEFVTHLREVYVTAVVEASSALNADHDNWCHLLAEKGAQMSSQTLKRDFENSYKGECACPDGMTESDWENLVHTRRSRLGTRVNTFIKGVEKFIRNIPDPGQIYLMTNAIAISNETFLNSPDNHSRKPPYSVCFIML